MTLFHDALNRKATASRAVRLALSLIILSLFALTLTLPPALLAQDDADEVVRVRTDLVTAPAFVTDSSGQRIRNLTAADFELSDDGRVVKIEYFAAGTDEVAMLFALDASGSARELIGQQRQTASALFSRFGRASKVAVMRFAETAQLAAPFSTEPDKAISAFDLPATGNRRTAIFDAAARAIQTFGTLHSNSTERRIIILISDGLDTVSATRPRQVIDAARASGISIYAIQLPLYAPRDGRLVPRKASKGFREMAEQTGGRYFMAGDAKSALELKPALDLSNIFQAIEEDLRGQYMLGYYPGEAAQEGGRPHSITLKLKTKDKSKLRVRLLRTGYTLKQ